MVDKRFSGTVVAFYQVGDNTVYAVSEEHEKGKIIDCDIYDALCMTDDEINELVNAGGVYTDVDTPKVKVIWIKENGKEIAISVIVGTGYDAVVELQSCNTDIPKIKNAFQI